MGEGENLPDRPVSMTPIHAKFSQGFLSGSQAGVAREGSQRQSSMPRAERPLGWNGSRRYFRVTSRHPIPGANPWHDGKLTGPRDG